MINDFYKKTKLKIMNKKQLDKLMHILLVISAILIALGAIFKLQHYPYGNTILWTGFWSNFVLSSIEISRLKKIIKAQQKETPQKE